MNPGSAKKRAGGSENSDTKTKKKVKVLTTTNNSNVPTGVIPPWSNISFATDISMAQVEQLEGLMSVEVVDGSYYESLKQGVLVDTTSKAKVPTDLSAKIQLMKEKKKEKKKRQLENKKNRLNEATSEGISNVVSKTNKTVAPKPSTASKVASADKSTKSFQLAEDVAVDEDDMDEDMFDMDEDMIDMDEDMLDMEDEDEDTEQDIQSHNFGEFNFSGNSMPFATFDDDEEDLENEDFEDFVDNTGFQQLLQDEDEDVILQEEDGELVFQDEDDELLFEDEDGEDMEFETDVTDLASQKFDYLKSFMKPADVKKAQKEEKMALKAKLKEEEELKLANEKALVIQKEEEKKRAAEEVFETDIDFFNAYPAYSQWQPFSLHPLILRGIRRAGFVTPTVIQREVLLPAVKYFKDVVGASQTGSGKTLSFALPIINTIILDRYRRGEGAKYENALAYSNTVSSSIANQKGKNRPKSHNHVDISQPLIKFNDNLTALILTPTRELAVQIVDHINSIACYAHVKAVAVVGGLATEKQERLLSYNPPIVVATPGRLWEFIAKGLPIFKNMAQMKFFVLDEADRMVANGHFPELDQIISYVQSFRDLDTDGDFAPDQDELMEEEVDTTPKKTEKQTKMQIFLFSATLTIQDEGRGRGSKTNAKMEEDTVVKPGRKMLGVLAHRLPFNGKPHVVDFSSAMLVSPTLDQVVMECVDEDRDAYLYAKLHPLQGHAIVFVNAIQSVRRITNYLRELKFEAFPLHANMQQNQRLSVIDKFKKHKRAVIISTDVAARGIDIPSVELVIQYHVPFTPEIYVHRAGRTARAGASGTNILFVGPKETNEYKRLIHVLGASGLNMRHVAPNTKFMWEIRRRFKLADYIAKHVQIQESTRARRTWEHEAAASLGIVLDDEDGEEFVSSNSHKKAKLHIKKRQNENSEDFEQRVSSLSKENKDIRQKREDLKYLLSLDIYTRASH